DESRLVTEQLRDSFSARSNHLFITAANPLIADLSRQPICDFTPRSMSENTITHRPSVCGIGVLSIECGNAYLLLWDNGWINKLRYVRDALHATRGMHQCNQTMRFATTIAGIQAKN